MSDVVATNNKAGFNYEILKTFECGIVLKGCEVKSIRSGHISLLEAWVQVEDQELVLRGLMIPAYKMASFDLPDSARPRKLLAHKREIAQMQVDIERKGMTLIPLKLYFSRGRLKVLVGVCRGKSTIDKRADVKEREDKRHMARALKKG